MKDASKEEYEASRPGRDVLHLIRVCLEGFYTDTKHKNLDSVASGGLSYEEVIGTLLVCRDEIEELRLEIQQLWGVLEENDIEVSL